MAKKKNINKIWKWVLSTLVLILFGTSAILNIIYLPKYFTSNQNNTEIKNIDVVAYDENNIPLFNYIYQTNQTTLGNLMAEDDNTFELKSYSVGRMLIAISYYDEQGNKQTKKGNDQNWWEIFYNNNPSFVGIDSILLHQGDKVKLQWH